MTGKEYVDKLTREGVCSDNLNFDMLKIAFDAGVKSQNVFAELNDETAKCNAMLLDKVLDLQEQIEKMKCCSNCKHQWDEKTGIFDCVRDEVCHNKSEWELMI